MRAVIHTIDLVLREPRGSIAHPSPAPTPTMLLAVIFTLAPLAGVVIGTYAFDSPQRSFQVLYSAIKLPLLLIATTAICLPGFFVLSSVVGLRDRFADSCRAILAGQAAMSVTLAALAPMLSVVYISGISYDQAKIVNAIMFAISTFVAQLVIRRLYRPLIAENSRHRTMLVVWAVIYIFVGIQMAWILRPFIGQPGASPTFFREGALTNAYVDVGRVIGRQLHAPGSLRNFFRDSY